MKSNKFIGVLTALACSSTLLTSLWASAATYSIYDVNQDGVVNIFDSMVISQYLNGKYYIPNSDLKRLDVNKNQIIDNADVECIQAYLVGSSYSAKFYSREQGNKEINFQQYSSFTGDGASTSWAIRDYLRYNYKTKTSTTYSLEPSTTPLSAQEPISSYGVIPPDDGRKISTNAPENFGIVQLKITAPSSIYNAVNLFGTGFVVDRHKIATAAHCVYNHDNAKWGIKEGIYPITITLFGSDGKITTKTLKPVEVHVPIEYQKSQNKNYDYALITVEDDLFDEDHDCVQFSLSSSYNVTGTQFDHVPIYVTGDQSGVLYTDEGKIDTSEDNSTLLNFDVDADHGQSGSPVYTITKQNINGKVSYIYTALGVTTGEYYYLDENKNPVYTKNYGVRMTKHLLQFYSNTDKNKIGW